MRTCFLLNYFPTITDSSPDRAVIAYIISQAYQKRSDQEKLADYFRTIRFEISQERIYFYAL
jgi:hypothetical protein